MHETKPCVTTREARYCGSHSQICIILNVIGVMNLHEDLHCEAHSLVYGNQAVNARRSSHFLAPTRTISTTIHGSQLIN